MEITIKLGKSVEQCMTTTMSEKQKKIEAAFLERSKVKL